MGMLDKLDRLFVVYRRSWIALFWLALLFTLVMALLPKPPPLPGQPTDKFQHIVAFAVLTLQSFAAYPLTRWLARFGWLAAFGAVIELGQMIPVLGRSADLADWLADSAAILITIAITAFFDRWRRKG